MRKRNGSPFEDFQTRYILPSAIFIVVFMLVAAWYEVDYRDTDSLEETITAIVKWISVAVASTMAILILWEAFDMVTARRYREEGRRERDTEWVDWLRRRDAALAEGKEFNEPSPADKDKPSRQ